MSPGSIRRVTEVGLKGRKSSMLPIEDKSMNGKKNSNFQSKKTNLLTNLFSKLKRKDFTSTNIQNGKLASKNGLFN